MTVLRGAVWLVGAGPGDPELLTVKAVRVLREAEVVAYDELVSDEILACAPPQAERIPVGRRAGGCKHHDERIHPLVIARAKQGRVVVRLKGGDPFVFGRGGEEAEALAEAGIACEVVPGISAALGAAASARIPLTHREASASVTFATAHRARDEAGDLARAVPPTGTVVLYMALGRLEATMRALVASGRAPDTPVAIVAAATTPRERVVTGTVATIAAIAERARIEAPAIAIVGDVVGRAVDQPVRRTSRIVRSSSCSSAQRSTSSRIASAQASRSSLVETSSTSLSVIRPRS